MDARAATARGPAEDRERELADTGRMGQ